MSQSVICEAIKARRVVTFLYAGKARTVEPHLLGYDKDGDLTLSAWQRSGGSGVGFRDFQVAKLSGLATTAESFERARPGYNPADRTMPRVVCRL